MKTPLYRQYADTKPVAVYPMSNWGGVEILEIDGIEKNGKKAVIAAYNFGSRQKIARHTIFWQMPPVDKPGDVRAYIRKGNRRIYFDECMWA